jgi:hypothetical protein
MTQCSLVGGYERFGGIYYAHSQGIFVLKMEKVYENCMEKLLRIIIRRDYVEDHSITPRRYNLKSYEGNKK